MWLVQQSRNAGRKNNCHMCGRNDNCHMCGRNDNCHMYDPVRSELSAAGSILARAFAHTFSGRRPVAAHIITPIWAGSGAAR